MAAGGVSASVSNGKPADLVVPLERIGKPLGLIDA
jgi:hypothetical protein